VTPLIFIPVKNQVHLYLFVAAIYTEHAALSEVCKVLQIKLYTYIYLWKMKIFQFMKSVINLGVYVCVCVCVYTKILPLETYIIAYF